MVGTFGIGAMANFGVASELTVTTESSKTGQGTRSSVEREKLSATEPCISIETLPSEGHPGTTVEIVIDAGVKIGIAEEGSAKLLMARCDSAFDGRRDTGRGGSGH